VRARRSETAAGRAASELAEGLELDGAHQLLGRRAVLGAAVPVVPCVPAVVVLHLAVQRGDGVGDGVSAGDGGVRDDAAGGQLPHAERHLLLLQRLSEGAEERQA